ncbi:hypothetical protein PYCCODRAFT_1426589 [Trametes coccinea BRFM310]|uniref:Uncharacterized protein n=1 Tax=Trametes coccinea (strain BRFM310) TaxID=1353009 RepID=A0A1Y2IKA0_TRAC3|nr:hypothetical protein PYCCODRAFT_1426589 [Trametes coccinea BRFM310]
MVAVPNAIPAASMESASSTGIGSVFTASVASAGHILLTMLSEETLPLPVAQAAIATQSTARTEVDAPEQSGSRVVKSVEDILMNIVSDVATMWADLSKVGGEGAEYRQFMAALGGCSTCNRIMTIDTVLLHTCAGKPCALEVGGSMQAAVAEGGHKRKIHPMPPSPRVLLKNPHINEGSKGSSSVKPRCKMVRSEFREVIDAETGRVTYELVEY